MFTLIKGNGNEIPKEIDPKNNICVIKTDTQGNKEWFYGANIVTNDGDIYYAKTVSYTHLTLPTILRV